MARFTFSTRSFEPVFEKTVVRRLGVQGSFFIPGLHSQVVLADALLASTPASASASTAIVARAGSRAFTATRTISVSDRARGGGQLP